MTPPPGADLGRRLGEPLRWTIQEVDYVRDLMVVDVRYREPALGGTRSLPMRWSS